MRFRTVAMETNAASFHEHSCDSYFKQNNTLSQSKYTQKDNEQHLANKTSMSKTKTSKANCFFPTREMNKQMP